MSKLYAPGVKYYWDTLHENGFPDSLHQKLFTDESYQLVRLAFDHLEQIQPSECDDELKVWEVWVPVERGTLEDYGDYEEWKDYNDGASYEEFRKEWLAYFPDEVKWFHLSFVKRYLPETWLSIQLDYRVVLEFGEKKPDGFERDVEEFAGWLLEVVDNTIQMLKEGRYASFVEESLPAIHRTGTIKTSDLWKVCPEEKKWFFQNLSQQEVDDFCSLVEDQEDESGKIHTRLGSFTANDFYRCCSLGYVANDYPCAGMTPKEQYYKFADGRDDGLSEIDPNSPQAFEKWRIERFGGHPWEVCRGGNSTHVALGIVKGDDGYILKISGSAVTRCVEAIKFYLVLRKEGFPVYIADGQSLVQRLKGEELIGIVPDGVIPRYCESYFPGQHIIRFMNLPEESAEKLAPYCIWQPISELRLSNG